MIAGLVGRLTLAVPLWLLAAAAAAPAHDAAEESTVDSVTSLSAAIEHAVACSDECPGVIYFWTPRMPLSRSAISEITEAAGSLGIALSVVRFEELDDYAEGRLDTGASDEEMAEAMLAAGALSHAPAVVVHRGGEVVGPALLGHKRAAAYTSLIAARLAGSDGAAKLEVLSTAEAVPAAALGTAPSLRPAPNLRPDADRRPDASTDYAVHGIPGAYFKWVPGRNAIAYETDGRVYLFDLDDGESLRGPGHVDFIPTPDGRYFVTPGEADRGLEFYDTDEVFDALAASGRADRVDPVFLDDRMRDQYPSIGVLQRYEDRVTYRILTSWFDGLSYRDYDVRFSADGRVRSVQPLGEPVEPCPGHPLSTPILSQDGREVAVRDERTGTTKIFLIRPDASCEEVLDFGIATRKVAWHAGGRLIAFSTPRLRSAPAGGDAPGIFVLDRDGPDFRRVVNSEGASRLAFPDFVGDSAVAFLVPPERSRDDGLIRVVSPLP